MGDAADAVDAAKLVETALGILDGAGVPRHDALLAINVMGFMNTSQAVVMSVQRNEFVESYDQLMAFWVDALIAKLEAVRTG